MGIWVVPNIRGTFLGGAYNKDHSILRSILWGPLNFRNIPVTPRPLRRKPNHKYSLHGDIKNIYYELGLGLLYEGEMIALLASLYCCFLFV